jgi:type II secretory pathway component PulF
MTTFAYWAADASGRRSRGRLTADSDTTALAQLAERGLFPLRLRRVAGPTGRVPRRELALALQSLADLTTAGIPVDHALLTTSGLFRGHTAEAFRAMCESVRTGTSLSSALVAQLPGVPAVPLGIIRSGEGGSQLSPSLRLAALVLARDVDLRDRIRHAVTYPALLAVLGTVAIGVIVGVVVPRFAALLADLGQRPPLATRVMLAASAGLRRWGVVILAAGGIAAALAARWGRTARGAALRDATLLRLPVIGPLLLQVGCGRVATALAAMTGAGLPLSTALGAAANAAGNRALATRWDQVRHRVTLGESFARALERERAVPPNALRVIALGEASGRLSAMMEQAGKLAETEADRRMATLTGLLEPLLIVAFALVIGFVAAALLQAVYSLRPEATP